MLTKRIQSDMTHHYNYMQNTGSDPIGYFVADDNFGDDEVDNAESNMELSDRQKQLIAGLQKNITRIITLSNDDLQVLVSKLGEFVMLLFAID